MQENINISNISSQGLEIKLLSNDFVADTTPGYGTGVIRGPVGDVFDWSSCTNADGTYKGDDPTTKDVNEAWVSPFPTPSPSIQWTRKQLIGYCNEFGVLHSDDDSKLQLLNKIEEVYPDGI